MFVKSDGIHANNAIYHFFAAFELQCMPIRMKCCLDLITIIRFNNYGIKSVIKRMKR